MTLSRPSGLAYSLLAHMDMRNESFQEGHFASYNQRSCCQVEDFSENSCAVLSRPQFPLMKEAAMLELTLLDLLRAAGALAIVLGAICLALKDEALDQGLAELD